MDIFDSANFNIFKSTFENIVDSYDDIISMVGGEVRFYVQNSNNPYSVAADIHNVINMIDTGYIDIVNGVEKIFENVNILQKYLASFTDYYDFLTNTMNIIGSNSIEDKTKVIACVLIFLQKGDYTVGNKKIYNILKSMCSYPTLRSLVYMTTKSLS